MAALGFQNTSDLNEENVNESYWTYYIAVPSIFIFLRQIMMCTVFTHESPIYSL